MDKISKAITIFTFGSLFPLFFVRLQDFQSSLFWLYSISMVLFLLFMYSLTSTYKPLPDLGYRPYVSVVIPAKNEEGVIQKTIHAVLDSDYPQDKLNMIVVDDGSTDKTGEKIKEIKSDRLIFIKHDKNYGKRAAFASGCSISKSDIVICIDSDSFVDKNAIKLLVQPFIDRQIVAVCGHGKAYNKDKNLLTILQHYWYQEMFRLIKGMEAKLGCVTCCSGILAAYRRNLILPVIEEWLNEKFFGRQILIGDDRQLTNLISRGGVKRFIAKSQADDRTLTMRALSTHEVKVTYQSNAITYTMVPDNIKQFIKQQLRWKRAWVHGTILGIKFMWKKPFPIPLYYYGYQFLTYFSPIAIFTWMIIRPINGDWRGPLVFILSVLYIGFLHGLNIWRFNRTSTECIFYRMLFVFMSIFLSIFILPYAWGTVWKGGWVTRSDTNVKSPKSSKFLGNNLNFKPNKSVA